MGRRKHDADSAELNMIIVTDWNTLNLRWYDEEMNQTRQHTMTFLPYAMTIRNDMMIMIDTAGKKLIWYDEEMNRLREHQLTYTAYGITTQNDMIIVFDGTATAFRYYSEEMQLLRTRPTTCTQNGMDTHNDMLITADPGPPQIVSWNQYAILQQLFTAGGWVIYDIAKYNDTLLGSGVFPNELRWYNLESEELRTHPLAYMSPYSLVI